MQLLSKLCKQGLCVCTITLSDLACALLQPLGALLEVVSTAASAVPLQQGPAAVLFDIACSWLQMLGENAVLISSLLEAVGTFARVLGPSFASKGLFLNRTLLLLLERLADPCPLVASSAGLALGSLCLHCGYPTRQALLASNADYLVDGLCRQLRSIGTHPR